MSDAIDNSFSTPKMSGFSTSWGGRVTRTSKLIAALEQSQLPIKNSQSCFDSEIKKVNILFSKYV